VVRSPEERKKNFVSNYFPIFQESRMKLWATQENVRLRVYEEQMRLENESPQDKAQREARLSQEAFQEKSLALQRDFFAEQRRISFDSQQSFQALLSAGGMGGHLGLPMPLLPLPMPPSMSLSSFPAMLAPADVSPGPPIVLVEEVETRGMPEFMAHVQKKRTPNTIQDAQREMFRGGIPEGQPPLLFLKKALTNKMLFGATSLENTAHRQGQPKYWKNCTHTHARAHPPCSYVYARTHVRR
jgi:hypothetical protein